MKPTAATYDADALAAAPDALALFLQQVRRYPLLSAAQEVELAKRVEVGDHNAKEKMINSNLRLVVSLAKKYGRRDLALLAERECRDQAAHSREPHAPARGIAGAVRRCLRGLPAWR